MHELSIANEIFKILQAHAPQGNAIAIGIRLGAWSCVGEQSLQNSFRWVTDQTPFCNVRLDIERIEEVWICKTCQQSFDQSKQSESDPQNCPWCGEKLELLDGLSEMSVEWIELLDQQGT
ncbi:MAG: hydrogenase maturation nickel metallochaperone HypA [Planctomycetaceae bacterium]|jgi:hydrogenase nickel insertion protein HypA|nr:hydrogenase maturation nickel metallochaperone HypA [Planctomycetaceae bacterium]